MFKYFRSADEDSRQEWVIFGSLALVGLLAAGGVAWHKHRVHARHAEIVTKPAIALPTVLTRLRGDITPKSITLTGQVATEAEHQALVARATAAFAKLAVVDQISVAPAGVNAPMRWHEPTLGVLGEISSLRWGTLLCDNSLIKVDGDVVTEAAAIDLRTKFAVHQAPGITFDTPNVKVMPAPKVEPEVLKGLVLKHLEGKVVEFETGSDKMTAKGRAVVDELAPELKDLTGLVIQVAGHTDNAGDSVKNMDLSARRAATVVAYLATKGVDKSHLVPKGFGDSQPKASNDTPAGKQQNRRIEFLPEELH